MYYKNLLHYRNAWLGVAMIWIIAFHLNVDFHNDFLHFIMGNGYGGVDICFFASGIGCYFSLSADPDVGRFIKRRMKRILPTYLLFIILWLAYRYLRCNFDWQMALGNILAVQAFTGHGNDFNWYISAIILFYLLAPYFKAVVDRTTTVGKVFVLILLLILSIPFWGADVYIIAVTRLPIFYVGMLFANMCQNEKKISPMHIVLAILSLIVGVLVRLFLYRFPFSWLWSYGLLWYPFLLITIPLCMIISYAMAFFEKRRPTRRIAGFLSLCGKYSFELYLLHIPLVPILFHFIDQYPSFIIRFFICLTGVMLLTLGCYILRRATKLYEHIINLIKSPPSQFNRKR